MKGKEEGNRGGEEKMRGRVGEEGMRIEERKRGRDEEW